MTYEYVKFSDTPLRTEVVKFELADWADPDWVAETARKRRHAELKRLSSGHYCRTGRMETGSWRACALCLGPDGTPGSTPDAHNEEEE